MNLLPKLFGKDPVSELIEQQLNNCDSDKSNITPNKKPYELLKKHICITSAVVAGITIVTLTVLYLRKK